AVRVAEVPARSKHAERFGEEAPTVVVEVRRLDVEDDIEGLVGERELVRGADVELEPLAADARTREPHVLFAQVDADVTARRECATYEARPAAAAAADLE